eukprot:3531090-Ditylum_brightwellii.AAC.1
MLDLPPSHIYRHVKKLFDSLAYYQSFKLNTRKRKLLVAFIADLPQMYLLATSRKIVMNAFVHDGMTDDSDYLWLNINQMLTTLGYTLSTEEQSFIFDNFNLLYELIRDNCDIPAILFNELEFPEDNTSSGDVVP